MDDCIIRTLSYFDVFDYPLTFSEIKKYLCCEIDCTDDDLLTLLNSMSVVQEASGYYYLLGRNEITSKREERGSISIQKFAKAKVVAKILSAIPTIELIGVSGSLSMSNATASDDIDFFFITKKNTLWLTRLLIILVLSVTNQKRKKQGGIIRDKICPNMFVDVSKMLFSGKKKTVYTAHEIMQMKLLFERNDTYSRFLAKNKWVKEALPNVVIPKGGTRRKSSTFSVIEKIAWPLEKIAYFAQVFYMRKSRTIEVISGKKAFFHPLDRQSLIIDMYDLRYNRYKEMYEENLWVDRDEARFYLEEKKIRILN